MKVFQIWYTAHIENGEDPYDYGHLEDRPYTKKIYTTREEALRNIPDKDSINLNNWYCYVESIWIKQFELDLN